MKKKKLTKSQKRKRALPLIKYEDKWRAIWFSIGAGLILIIWFMTI